MSDPVLPSTGRGVFGPLVSGCSVAGDRADSVGTDDLLYALLYYNPDLRLALVASTSGETLVPPARIGPPRVPVSAAPSTVAGWEALGAMREAHWTVFRDGRGRRRGVPFWEEEAREAVELSLDLAARQGRPWAGADHLFDALVQNPGSRAGEYFRRAGMEPQLLRGISARVWPKGDNRPRTPIVDFLSHAGSLRDPASGSSPSLKGRLLSWTIRMSTRTGPVLAMLVQRAATEAIRLAHARVAPVHLVLAVLSYEHQLEAAALSPPLRADGENGRLLSRFGVVYQAAVPCAATLEPMEDVAPSKRPRAVRGESAGPHWTASAARAADRAGESARRAGVEAGPIHLLHAALTEPDGSAADLLRGFSVDPDDVLAAASSALGGVG